MSIRKVDERVLFRGSLVTVGQVTLADASGARFEREVVRHPGAVAVVPVLDGGRTVILVRQFRVAVERNLLEIPAGKRDVVDEAIEVTAARELEEEVGMRPGRLVPLVEFYTSPGFCDERVALFLALDLEPCEASAQGLEEEHMTVERVALADVPGLVAAGELVDGKSIIALGLAREALSGGAPGAPSEHRAAALYHDGGDSTGPPRGGST